MAATAQSTLPATKTNNAPAPPAQQQPGPHLSPLWAQLIKEQGEQQHAAADGAAEGHVFFVGPRGSGKSSLMARVLDAAVAATSGQSNWQGGGNTPSCGGCVSYAYVRPATTITSNSSSTASKHHAMAHFWEFSSGDSSGSVDGDTVAARALLDAVRLFVTPKTVASSCVVLALDVSSEPSQLVHAEAWLGAVRAKLAATYAAYESRGLATVPQQLKQRECAAAGWPKHEDAAAVDVAGVPVVIIGTRWDALSCQSAERQLAVAVAMRAVAHAHGAHLAFVSCVADSGSGVGGLPFTSAAPKQPQPQQPKLPQPQQQQQQQQQRPSSDGTSSTLDAAVSLIVNLAFKGLERATRKLRLARWPPRLDPLVDGALLVPAGADRLRAIACAARGTSSSSSTSSLPPGVKTTPEDAARCVAECKAALASLSSGSGSGGGGGGSACESSSARPMVIADPRYSEPAVDAAVAAVSGAGWWSQLVQQQQQM